MSQIEGAGHPASARTNVAYTRQVTLESATRDVSTVAAMGALPAEPGQRRGTVAREPMDDLELVQPVSIRTEDLPRVYAQAQAYAEELRRLYVERQAAEAELARKVVELERSHEQLLAYATDLGALNGLLQATYRQTLKALGRAVDRRDGMTGGHCVRVAEYSRLLGEQILGSRPQELQVLEYGALLHDVGKITVPDAILRKNGPLTDEEWAVMRQHPCLGHEILYGIGFLTDALPIVLYPGDAHPGAGRPGSDRARRAVPGPGQLQEGQRQPWARRRRRSPTRRGNAAGQERARV